MRISSFLSIMRLPFPMKYSQQVLCMRSKQGGGKDFFFHSLIFIPCKMRLHTADVHSVSSTPQVYHRYIVQIYVLASHSFGFWLWIRRYLFCTVLRKLKMSRISFMEHNYFSTKLKSCFKNLILGWTKSMLLFICFGDYLSVPVKTQRRMLIQFLTQMSENLIFKLSKQKSNILISSKRSSTCFFWHIKNYWKELGKNLVVKWVQLTGKNITLPLKKKIWWHLIL